MSVKDLRVIGEVLEDMADKCVELNRVHDDDHSAAALGWLDDLIRLTNFGGRAKNASLRDEVLILASNSIR